MTKPRWASTDIGRTWIAQFDEADRSSAAALLNTMLLLNEDDVSVALRGLLNTLAEGRRGLRGRVGLYAEREFQEAAAFKIVLTPDPNGRNRRRAVGRAGPVAVSPKRGSRRVGSEGLIAFTISQVTEAWPRIFANQPGPDRIRARRPISTLAIVTDFIGSGHRVARVLDKFWRVESVKAWVSLGYLDFKVVAAAGTPIGIESIRGHRLEPEVLVDYIAPTIFDARRSDRWLKLLDTYGPQPGAVDAAGYEQVGSLIAFSYRMPNNVPAMIRLSGNGWRSLYNGPAPESLRQAFGLNEPGEMLKRAAEALGVKLDEALSANDAELVLALTAIGSRWAPEESNAIAEQTGLSVRRLAVIRQDAIRMGLLRVDGRLTEQGQVTRRTGLRLERQRPTIPTSDIPYYPMQLRVPR